MMDIRTRSFKMMLLPVALLIVSISGFPVKEEYGYSQAPKSPFSVEHYSEYLHNLKCPEVKIKHYYKSIKVDEVATGSIYRFKTGHPPHYDYPPIHDYPSHHDHQSHHEHPSHPNHPPHYDHPSYHDHPPHHEAEKHSPPTTEKPLPPRRVTTKKSPALSTTTSTTETPETTDFIVPGSADLAPGSTEPPPSPSSKRQIPSLPETPKKSLSSPSTTGGFLDQIDVRDNNSRNRRFVPTNTEDLSKTLFRQRRQYIDIDPEFDEDDTPLSERTTKNQLLSASSSSQVTELPLSTTTTPEQPSVSFITSELSQLSPTSSGQPALSSTSSVRRRRQAESEGSESGEVVDEEGGDAQEAVNDGERGDAQDEVNDEEGGDVNTGRNIGEEKGDGKMDYHDFYHNIHHDGWGFHPEIHHDGWEFHPDFDEGPLTPKRGLLPPPSRQGVQPPLPPAPVVEVTSPPPSLRNRRETYGEYSHEDHGSRPFPHVYPHPQDYPRAVADSPVHHKPAHECTAPLYSGWTHYNWYQILLDNGGPPGGYLKGGLKAELTKVEDPCVRPVKPVHKNYKRDFTFKYTKVGKVFRVESVNVRLANTPHEFMDYEGQLIWAPPNATRFYQIIYRKDDTGLYVRLITDITCKFRETTNRHTDTYDVQLGCVLHAGTFCDCDQHGREVCHKVPHDEEDDHYEQGKHDHNHHVEHDHHDEHAKHIDEHEHPHYDNHHDEHDRHYDDNDERYDSHHEEVPDNWGCGLFGGRGWCG